MKRFLITTADESTWKTDTPVLFLGEWCKRYKRKEIWAGLNYETVKYHWDDREKLLKDYTYLSNLYEEVLSNLSKQLNEIHSVDHSLRYWRILIGPWLGPFIQMTFDRWTMVQKAVNEYDISETYILENDIFNNIPYDISHFSTLYCDDNWNRAIYSHFLKNWTNTNCITLKHPNFFDSHEGIESKTEKKNIITHKRLEKIIKKISDYIVKPDDGLIYGTYYPHSELIKLYFKLKQIPCDWSKNDIIVNQSNFIKRRWIFIQSPRNEYEKALISLIPLQIPTFYLEGYRDNINRILSLNWPNKPRFIMTSVSHIKDDIFKLWAAEKVESGSPLIISQHGGHYGSSLSSFQEDHELAICDKYLSWGWNSDKTDKIFPMDANKIIGKGELQWNPKGKVTLVSGAKPRYSYWLYSTFIASQWLDYFHDQCDFVRCLPQNIQDQTVVRLYPYDFGWDQILRWREQFPSIYFDEGHTNIKRLKNDSRIVISTYNATTLLETMAQNIPTIFFWNPEHNELRPRAEPYFEELIKVGIFHTSPESAAEKIIEIWDDVGLWWYAKETQRVRKIFCDEFAHLSKNFIQTLYDVLQEKNQ